MNPPRPGAPSAASLGLLFGALYFAQGIGEPTEGLLAQPVRSLLKQWGEDAAAIAAWSALLTLPWTVKPLYGLLTDFVPFLGQRRRSYLIASCAVAAAALLATGAIPWSRPLAGALLAALLVPAVALAFSDVVVDALMVELGQPRGLTGRLQSVQWASIWTATIATGALGGWLSATGRQSLGFLLCGAFAVGSLALALYAAREPARPAPAPSPGQAARALLEALREPGLLAVAAFFFLWTFNPFSSSVLYVHMTRELGFSEQFYGNTVSVLAAAAVLASVAYGGYCRQIPFPALLHASIALGAASTAAYLALSDERSALVISAVSGFAYMTGSLIQLDLAARVCPPALAGTLFATLMAVSNLSLALSTALGGRWYDGWAARLGTEGSFDLLVLAGALCTALCWLLLPLLPRPPSPRDGAGVPGRPRDGAGARERRLSR